jgi:hypothetical protein
MKLHKAGRILILIGLAIILYAFNMPVSVNYSDVVNIHMLSERQNMLILGGFVFLSGIVIFSTFKIKQTKEEELDTQKQQEALKSKARETLIDSVSKGRILIEKVTDAHGIHVSPYQDRPVARTLSGLYTGICLTLVLGTIFDLSLFRGTIFDYGFIFGLPMMLWLSFRPRSARLVITRTNALNISLICITASALFIREIITDLYVPPSLLSIGQLMALLPISGFFWVYAIKRIKVADGPQFPIFDK